MNLMEKILSFLEDIQNKLKIFENYLVKKQKF